MISLTPSLQTSRKNFVSTSLAGFSPCHPPPAKVYRKDTLSAPTRGAIFSKAGFRPKPWFMNETDDTEIDDTHHQPDPIIHQSTVYQDHGFCHLSQRLDSEQLNAISQLIEDYLTENQLNPTYCHESRLHEKIPQLESFLNGPFIQECFHVGLQGQCRIYYAKLLDKPPGSKWYTQWHQDRLPHTVLHRLKQKFSLEFLSGFLHTSTDETDLINALSHKTTALRIHLNPCHKNNGCMEVIAGSQHQGFLSHDQLQHSIKQASVNLEFETGELMLMHPLVIHRSLQNVSLESRRVIHVECIDAQLADLLYS